LIAQPAWNAILNGSSAVLVTAGYATIRSNCVQAHKACMLATVGASTAFLISYVDCHLRVGSIRFPGQGIARTGYLTMLGTHTIVPAAIVPLVIITLVRALDSAAMGERVRYGSAHLLRVLYQVYAAPHP
jgi:putative membrane protein